MKILTLITITLSLLCTVKIAYAQRLQRFSKAQVVQDIDTLFSNAEQIHPNLFHSLTKKQLYTKLDSLKRSLADSISIVKAYEVFSEATAYINEGHTGINTPKEVSNMIRDGRFKFIPVKLSGYKNGRMMVKAALSGKTVEEIEISSINSISAQKIWNQLLRTKGGLTSFRTTVIIQRFPLLLSAIGIQAPYHIVYTDAAQNEQSAVVQPISATEYETVFNKSADTKNYTFTVLNNGDGYLNFRSMSGRYNDFVRFADSVFKSIHEQKLNHLIVDLRENSGGNSSQGRYLLNYITNQPYRMAAGSELRASRQFIAQMQQPSLTEIYGDKLRRCLAVPIGDIIVSHSENLDQTGEIPNKYHGNVCFLIGPNTFSSANMLAATLKDYKLATLIGEDTGEPGNDYGELCNIILPNTQFVAFTSTTLWIRPSNNKADHQPIHPDYKVKRIGTQDNVLQFAQQWLITQQ
ncbi:hypothetical protein GCM10027037_34100 [Mucilaginibacter koreensis]